MAINEKEKRAADFFPNKERLKAQFEALPVRDQILGYLAQYGVDLDDFLVWPERRGSYLADLGILRHFLAGNIIIHPFDIRNLTPNSYEVSLGQHYYRQKEDFEKRYTYKLPDHLFAPESGGHAARATPMFNPYDYSDVESNWILCKPTKAKNLTEKFGGVLREIGPDEEIIIINPNQMILAHTEEFIGGRNVVATRVSNRSSVGRSMIEVCNDADLGHIGFISRWTLEIKNKGDRAIPLVVGERCAQISFFESEPSGQSYQGQFQEGSKIEEVIKSWTPRKMLAKIARRAF